MATSSQPENVQVGGQYWSAQLETFDALESDEYDVVVFRGGYGSGKTVLGSDWVLGVALDIPGSHNLVLAPDRTKGGPATYKGFFERLPGKNTVPDDADGDPENSPIVAGYHGTKHRLTLKNGSIIQLGGADVWSRFAGSEFNAIWMDEVAHYENTNLYDLHEMLVTRQRTKDGPNVTLWTSTGNGFNQFYDITEQQVDENGEELIWKDRLEIVTANSLNNPFLNEKDKMRAQFEGTEREKQALQGGFAAAEGLVYSDFSRETHIVRREDVEIRDDWRAYGYDYGFKDPRVLLEVGKTYQDQYVIWDSYYKDERPVEDLVDPDDGSGWLLENDKPEGVIYCDHDPEHIQKFRRAGFGAEAATKNIDEGIDEVQSVLDTDVDGRPGLLVVDDCTELIKELQNYKEEDVGSSAAVDHAADSLRYVVMGEQYADDTRTETRRRRGGSTGRRRITR